MHVATNIRTIFITRDYKPTLVKSLFHAIKNISRHEARKVKPKLTKSNIQLITMYNPVIKNIENILNDNLHISYGDLASRKCSLSEL